MKLPVYRIQSFVCKMCETQLSHMDTHLAVLLMITQMCSFSMQVQPVTFLEMPTVTSSFSSVTICIFFFCAPLLSRIEPVALDFPYSFQLLYSVEQAHQL